MRTTVTVRCGSTYDTHIHELPGFATPTPGLVAHQPPECTRCTDDGWLTSWVLTHSRSGLLVGLYPDPETAMACADALGAVCDWTASADDVLGHSAQAALSVIYGYGGRVSGAEPADRRDITEVTA